MPGWELLDEQRRLWLSLVKYRFSRAASEFLVVGTQGIGTHFSSSLNCRPLERHREQFVIVVAEFAWNGFLLHLE